MGKTELEKTIEAGGEEGALILFLENASLNAVRGHSLGKRW